MERFIEFLEKIILALINKLNIVYVMLGLVIFGIMNQSTVFEWFAVIGKAFKGMLP